MLDYLLPTTSTYLAVMECVQLGWSYCVRRICLAAGGLGGGIGATSQAGLGGGGLKLGGGLGGGLGQTSGLGGGECGVCLASCQCAVCGGCT